MPGIALPSASTTERISGITENRRNSLSTRSARSTVKAPAAGIREIATTAKSNQFQPDLKKFRRCTISLSRISTTKAAMMAWSAKVRTCTTISGSG